MGRNFDVFRSLPRQQAGRRNAIHLVCVTAFLRCYNHAHIAPKKTKNIVTVRANIPTFFLHAGQYKWQTLGYQLPCTSMFWV